MSDDLLSKLEQDARRLRVARKLPAKGKIDPDLVAQVFDAFHELVGSSSTLSYNQVARELGEGFSVPTLISTRKYVSGEFRGDADRIARGLNEWMEQHHDRATAPMPGGFVETAVAKRMLTIVRYVSNLGSIGLIYGPAGVGKTMVFRAVAAKYPGTLLVRVRRSTRRATGLAQAIAGELRLTGCRTMRDAQTKTIDELAGTRRLLLVDEAHQLHTDGLEFLRDLHDEAEVPIVLGGTKAIDEAVTDTEEWFGQFSRRISMRYDVAEDALAPDGSRKQDRPLFTVDEIRQVFESDTLRLTDAGAAYLARLSNVLGLGGLGLADKVVRVAALAAEDGQAIGAKLLRAVMAQMHTRPMTASIERRMEDVALDPPKKAGAA